MRSLRIAAGLAALPVLLSGCDLLVSGLYGPDPFSEPGVTTEFTTGRATIEIRVDDSRETIVLDQLAGGSQWDSFGATVTWRNDDGWSMTLATFEMGGRDSFGLDPGVSSDITIQRITDKQMWQTDSYMSGSCAVNVDSADTDRLSGTATCLSLRWTDGLDFNINGPVYIEDQPRFNAEITFRAQSKPDTQI